MNGRELPPARPSAHMADLSDLVTTKEELDAHEARMDELIRNEDVEQAANELDGIARRLLNLARFSLESQRMSSGQRDSSSEDVSAGRRYLATPDGDGWKVDGPSGSIAAGFSSRAHAERYAAIASGEPDLTDEEVKRAHEDYMRRCDGLYLDENGLRGILRDVLHRRSLVSVEGSNVERWSGGWDNWIAPFHACPRCGKSLNWFQSALGGLHIRVRCCLTFAFPLHERPKSQQTISGRSSADA